MDFIFLLTRHDRTVDHGLELIEAAVPLGVRHIGFKDVGVSRARLEEYHLRTRSLGAKSCLEMVDTRPGAARRTAAMAVEMGVDCLLGGVDVAPTLARLRGSGIEYYPNAGRPEGHPARLHASPDDVARDCRRAMAVGCSGVTLLAHRAVAARPETLVDAARQALEETDQQPRGRLIVAGNVSTPAMIHKLARAGVDAFTVGTAITEHQFLPDRPSMKAQIQAVMAACAAPPDQS